MDMTIFQVESNKVLPRQGGLLISAPFLRDWHFARSVVLVVDNLPAPGRCQALFFILRFCKAMCFC